MIYPRKSISPYISALSFTGRQARLAISRKEISGGARRSERRILGVHDL